MYSLKRLKKAGFGHWNKKTSGCMGLCFFVIATFYTGQTTEKFVEYRVFMNCMRIILPKRQTLFMTIHEIFPEIHLYHNDNKANKEPGGSVEVPKLLRSPCRGFKAMYRPRNSDILVPMTFCGPCACGNMEELGSSLLPGTYGLDSLGFLWPCFQWSMGHTVNKHCPA